ncbi:hypothetical protein Pint_26097 [Pistacia integerrima]|uniref:Uncharacterized protein n=1 Tax=Pistacia integerrima TaxID=434235 RepID=A0ACC0YG88_9ROSI|nr:hypothetical protein Pint_26097 [Pistacia integerrima]
MSSSIQNLTHLIFRGCGKLKYIFSSSIFKSFVNLRRLEIFRCEVLEEVIIFPHLEEIIEEQNDTISFHHLELNEEERKDRIFPRLECLVIKDLEKLTRFCSGNYIEFPFLKHLEIVQCPLFKAFMFTNISTDSEETQPFFKEKVALPSLEEMVISGMDNLKIIWNNQLSEHSFRKLQIVRVSGCQNLENLFPASIARNLFELEELEMVNCGVEEIVSKEERAEAAVMFVFPRVTFLKLSFLQRLRCFYPGTHSSEWLVLKNLEVYDCDDMKIFTSKFLSHQETNEYQVNVPVEQALFLVEKV